MLGLLIVIGTAIWVLLDAKKIGVRKGLIKGLANISPWGWFFCTIAIWIIAFPMYLYFRGKFKLALKTEMLETGVSHAHSEVAKIMQVPSASRNVALLAIVVIGWTFLMFSSFHILSGVVISSIYPDSATAIKQFSKVTSMPSFLIFLCLSGALTKFGKLPGSKKG
jgi:hypothetical protein